MKSLIIIISALLAGACPLVAQQELMLSQMSKVGQVNHTNPSFFPEGKRFVIGLPAFSVDAAHSGTVSYNDFFKEVAGKKVFDFGQAIAKLEPENTVTYQQRIETVSLGFRLPGKGKTALYAGHAIRLNSSLTYPKELMQLLWNGNAQFIGETIQIAPSTNTFDWHEVSVGLSRDLGKKIRLGAKVKYLAGISSLKTDQSAQSASIYTNPDIYQLRINTDYGFHSYGTVSAIDTNGYGFKVITNELGNQFQTKNAGVAFDLGITLRLTDKLTISASALDIGGQIKWKEAKYFRSKGTFEYDGVTIVGSGIINGSDSLDFSTKLDTLNDIFQFQKTDDAFESTLPARYYVTAGFDLTKRIRVGASLYYEDNTESNSALGVSVQWQPVKLLAVGAMYSTNARKASSLGFQVTVSPGPVQLFFASDNLLNAFTPYSTSNVNFRTGLGLVF
jgi:Family of unknown function (DUF5723)